jgi:hypothetical protein
MADAADVIVIGLGHDGLTEVAESWDDERTTFSEQNHY